MHIFVIVKGIKKMCRTVILILLFTGTVFSAYSEEMDTFGDSDMFVSEIQDKIATLDITINNTTKIQLSDISDAEYLEVFSILGVKVTRISLKDIIGICYIELPKGLYILKVGKIAQKVIVR